MVVKNSQTINFKNTNLQNTQPLSKVTLDHNIKAVFVLGLIQMDLELFDPHTIRVRD